MYILRLPNLNASRMITKFQHTKAGKLPMAYIPCKMMANSFPFWIFDYVIIIKFYSRIIY